MEKITIDFIEQSYKTNMAVLERLQDGTPSEEDLNRAEWEVEAQEDK